MNRSLSLGMVPWDMGSYWLALGDFVHIRTYDANSKIRKSSIES